LIQINEASRQPAGLLLFSPSPSDHLPTWQSHNDNPDPELSEQVTLSLFTPRGCLDLYQAPSSLSARSMKAHGANNGEIP
jgi:hypothetical protein